MDQDTPKHEPDARVVVVSFALLAAAIALLTLVLDSRSTDVPAATDRPTTRADLISTVTRAIPAAQAASAGKAPARVVVEENWAADESSRGTRPDAPR